MKGSFSLDYIVFPSRVMLFFYSNLCPLSKCSPLCLKGDSDCFLLPFVTQRGVSMTERKMRNASQFIVSTQKIKDRESGQL